MRKTPRYLGWALVTVSLLTAWPGTATAYIKVPPRTFGGVCLEPDHIAVLKVEKVIAATGVIVFKHVEQLKGKHDGSVVKHVVQPEVKGAKIILDWAVEGKTAVMFYFTEGPNRGNSHVCIDDYWYWAMARREAGKDGRPEGGWSAYQGEPSLLALFCGTADQLRDAVAKILRGEEVLVPCMASDDRQVLEQRRGKIQQVRASLKLVGGDTISRIASRPAFVGTVRALSEDGKRFTLLPAPTEKEKEPTAVDIPIGENTLITVEGSKAPVKLAVGQTVYVWLGKGEPRVATAILIGQPQDKTQKKPSPDTPEKKPDGKKPNPDDKKPEKKPEPKKTEERKPDRAGTVKALSADGKVITLVVAGTKKDPEPITINIRINEETKVTNIGKEAGKLAVGQMVRVWMQKGSENMAAEIQIGTPQKPVKKPLPEDKPKKPFPDGKKPVPDATEKKPEVPVKPKEPAKPSRDPAPTAGIIDTEVEKHLASIKIPASPQADDAEFLRRVTLDLTGRIPTYQRTVDFLDSKDPEKRRKLIVAPPS